MKLSLAAEALRTTIRARRPAFLWGAPGVGKSQIVAQTAEELDLELLPVLAMEFEPVDLRGLPRVSAEGYTCWATPEFLPRSGRGLLFLDELNAAPPAVQAICYRLVLDRRLGEYVLPYGWHVVAAGNRETDRAVTARMPTPLANRLVHIQVETDLDDWTRWAARNDVAPELIAFLRFRPELLHLFDPKSAEKAFPSPRSWAFVNDLLRAGPDPSIEHELLAGTVGAGAAAELIGFLQIFRELPSPEAIIADPLGAIPPEGVATLYALTGALAHRASEANVAAIIAFFDRLPDEFAVLGVKSATDRAPALKETAAFIRWAATKGALLS